MSMANIKLLNANNYVIAIAYDPGTWNLQVGLNPVMQEVIDNGIENSVETMTHSLLYVASQHGHGGNLQMFGETWNELYEDDQYSKWARTWQTTNIISNNNDINNNNSSKPKNANSG